MFFEYHHGSFFFSKELAAVNPYFQGVFPTISKKKLVCRLCRRNAAEHHDAGRSASDTDRDATKGTEMEAVVGPSHGRSLASTGNGIYM